MKEFFAGVVGVFGLFVLLGRVPDFREMVGLCIIIGSLFLLFEEKKE